jgi:hypothetical protein
MKKCIFTVNFGGYDKLRKPHTKTKGWDYICFTNNDITSEDWEIRKVDLDLPNFSAARHVYINSHKYLPEYDYSIMVGGQIEVKGDLDKFVREQFDTSKDFNLMKHPCRTDIYQEAACVVRENIDKDYNVNPQIERYKKQGLPENFGLSASGIIGRKHNTQVAKFERLWWHEVINGSTRDQLSFDYVRWRYAAECTHHWFPIFYWDLLHGEFFDIYKHGTDRFA